MSEAPQVTDGELGWDAETVSKTDVSDLEPHPKNTDIYGEEDLEDSFVGSVREKGVLEPLVVTHEERIISGHRRHKAAKQVGVETVPVRYSEFENELAEREALIEFNRQREKTPGQITNEFEEILEIERERAKERQAHGDTAPGKTKNASGNVSKSVSTNSDEAATPDPSTAREKAAEKVNAGVSGRTLEKGLNVKEKAQDGDDAAQEQWDKLQSGDTSFTAAEREVEEASHGGRGDDSDSDGNDIEQFTSQQTDEWSSPPEVVRPLDDAIGGFDLDPCSGAEQSPFADETYTEDDDGLAQEWFGSVWVNPPYSDMSSWVDKATAEAVCDGVETVVFLCKGDSSTQWWQTAAADATLITAIDGRLSFGDGGNSAPFPSHIVVFGSVNEALVDALGEQGANLTVGWDDE